MSRVHVYVCTRWMFCCIFRLSGFSPPSFSGGPIPSHWLVVEKRPQEMGGTLERLGRQGDNEKEHGKRSGSTPMKTDISP